MFVRIVLSELWDESLSPKDVNCFVRANWDLNSLTGYGSWILVARCGVVPFFNKITVYYNSTHGS